MTKVSNRRGFFRSVLDALVEARQRQANVYLDQMQLSLNDEELAARGMDRAELKRRARRSSF